MSDEQQETAGSKRMSAVIQAPPDYVHMDTITVYAHKSLLETPPERDGKPFRVPDLRDALNKLASRFEGQVVVGEDESRTRGGADHIMWSLYFDTPETAKARTPRRNGKRPTEKDVPKLMQERSKLALDDEVIAEAAKYGITPKAAANARVAQKYGMTVEELQELIRAFLND